MRITFDPAASDEPDSIFAWIAKDSSRAVEGDTDRSPFRRRRGVDRTGVESSRRIVLVDR
jgi:hypothetical protein